MSLPGAGEGSEGLGVACTYAGDVGVAVVATAPPLRELSEEGIYSISRMLRI